MSTTPLMLPPTISAKSFNFFPPPPGILLTAPRKMPEGDIPNPDSLEPVSVPVILLSISSPFDGLDKLLAPNIVSAMPSNLSLNCIRTTVIIANPANDKKNSE